MSRNNLTTTVELKVQRAKTIFLTLDGLLSMGGRQMPSPQPYPYFALSSERIDATLLKAPTVFSLYCGSITQS